jgi:2-oxoglutarate dehydrogenase E2 component (dihydrolipoamide succinyltransferase)
MGRFEFTLPAMGEGIIEAAITRWHVSQGDRVTVDQPLLEVATDKVDSEIPSPVEGTIIRLVYNEGEIPRVGQVIAIIDTGMEASAEHMEERQVRKVDTPEDEIFREPDIAPVETDTRKPSGADFISPLVRFLAIQRNIPAHELKLIKGTGLDGRITKDDIRYYIIHRKPHEDLADQDIPVAEPAPSMQEITPEDGDEVFEMDRMRKLIASHMVRSKKISPHVTSFLEADVTALVDWREQNKSGFFLREQVKLTFTPIFVEAVARALKEFPNINVSLSGEKIIRHKNINIGIATALHDGNLIVPVIRNADRENLGGIARKVADLAERARSNALMPADIRGGTFTITNIGQYNNLTGTPIINQPEAAILAIGTIIKKPWAVRTTQGYGLAVRDISMLSLTYDHRVIDGALGGRFLSRIVSYLENFEISREI